MSEPSAEDHPVADPSGVRRLSELDALRGLAALSVVFLHFHDMWVTGDPLRFPRYQRLILEALRFSYSGSEAVILFFVLSGLVLALPYAGGRNQNYPTFCLRRVLRIWGPYVVALALAVAGDAVWHNHAYHGLWASKVWSEPLSPGRIAAQVPLIGRSDAQYLFVTWTLTEEMRISLAFPCLVWVSLRLRGVGQLIAAFVLSLLAVVLIDNHAEGDLAYDLLVTVHYAAFFILGIFLATHLIEITAIWRRIGKKVRAVALAGTLVTYVYDEKIASHIVPHLHFAGREALAPLAIAQWLAGIGACGWIILGLNLQSFRRILISRAPQFLGKISFSLYLVHPVVLFSLTFGPGRTLSWRGQFALYIATVIPFAWGFHSLVEEPFIELSRSVRLRMRGNEAQESSQGIRKCREG